MRRRPEPASAPQHLTPCGAWAFGPSGAEGPGSCAVQTRECRTLRLLLETIMTLGTILLIILILALLGAIPSWPHSRSWGYGPSGVIGLILLIIVILLVMGRL